MPWPVLTRSALSVALVASAGCGESDKGEVCVPVDAGAANVPCTPLYEPSFDQVFARTLQPTCAKSGVSCHSTRGRQGGLAFDDADEAYRMMLDETRTVRAGDPSCSSLVGRIVATTGDVRMPPGRSLDIGEQCAIVQWIANGARR